MQGSEDAGLIRLSREVRVANDWIGMLTESWKDREVSVPGLFAELFTVGLETGNSVTGSNCTVNSNVQA